METESRPISTVAAISLAGLTAAVVLGGGIFIVERGTRPGPASTGAPVQASSVASSGQSSPSVVAAPTIAEPTATVSASPAEPAAPDELPPTLGVLTVRGKDGARVYVNGMDK